ncbi:NADAR family protein [Caballeronia sp. 15715]|uniref:NADAR family protein n=1 Tax=Caballeronia sp. 15715 TaxID=3391030 RepID=UPI0039E61BB2
MQEIEFYRANQKPYGVFSNLYKRAIIFDGIEYPTSEHAYQAGKPRKDSVREWLMAAPSPSLLAMAAHGLYVWDVHPEWSKTKFDRMKRVLTAKFTQHLDLQEILLSTGDAQLTEVATVDNAVNRLWGQVNGVGKNMLGTLLMEVRSEIQTSLTKPSQTKKKPAVPRRKSNREKLAA